MDYIRVWMCVGSQKVPPPPGWKRPAYRIQRNGVSIAMLHSWYTYAGPLVSLCWTFGTTMLDLWYQDAILLWYRFFNVFTI